MSGGTGPVGAATSPTAGVNAKQQVGVKDYQQGYLDSFFTQVLIDDGLPVNATNIAVLKAQTQQEGSSAAYNPLDLEVGGAKYNPQGVTNFTSIQDGITATAKVLKQGNMRAFYNALAGNTGTSTKVDPVVGASIATKGLGLSDWLGGGAGSAANQGYGSHVANLVSLNADHSGGPNLIQQVAMGPLGTAAQDVQNVLTPEEQLANFLTEVNTVSFWIRIGLILLGAALVLAGIKALAGSTGSDLREGQPAPTDGPIDKAVKTGAVAAA
jgi:hypothetical protein